MTRIGSSVALLALAAGSLAAQQPGMMRRDSGMMHRGMMPHMMGMEQMMAPMMGAMAYTPDHLLARKDSLALTAQQVTRLTALRDAAKTAHDRAAADAKAHMDALVQAFNVAKPDTNAVRQHFQGVHAAMGTAHGTMLAAAAQAKALLTDEQRARVDAWAGAMMGHGMGPGPHH